jgi:hypothetical protein
MSTLNGERVITPAQLANLRASVHARRAVPTEDVRLLLDAYDSLRRDMFAVRQSAEALFRTTANAI